MQFVSVDGPKDPWPRVLSLPGRFVGDPASLARDNMIPAFQAWSRFLGGGAEMRKLGVFDAVFNEPRSGGFLPEGQGPGPAPKSVTAIHLNFRVHVQSEMFHPDVELSDKL